MPSPACDGVGEFSFQMVHMVIDEALSKNEVEEKMEEKEENGGSLSYVLWLMASDNKGA